MSGWVLSQTCFPGEGGILDQDNWLMRAFKVMKSVFYEIDQERQEEDKSARELNALHEKTKRGK
jgi:hypothetical protein